MFDALLAAAQTLSAASDIAYLAIGIVVGLVFGAIPGLGGATTIALLIPFTYGMAPDEAMALMGGVMGSAMFGGSIPAILLNTPGAAPNAATCFDGYPLAQQGKAGVAIGAAATASALGGLFGVIVLAASLPLLKKLVIAFGPPEFFLLALLGLSAIAVSTGGMFLRGMIAAGWGLALSFVGYDGVSGGLRFTLGSAYLWNGIDLVPALIGLFALSEMLRLSVSGGTVAPRNTEIRLSDVYDGIKATLRNMPTVLRGSVIGALVGAMPGVGGTVAAFLAYSTTVQLSKEPETFGKGNILGVIAPEAAHQAKDGGTLIPTLAFGIPAGGEMAVFLGVLVLHGIQPGPMLLIEHEGTILTLVIALAVSCVFASLIGLALARWLSVVTLVNVSILVPAVVGTALLGAYGLHSEFGDVVAAAVFGAIGYVMAKFHYPRISLVIALVLGGLAERNYHQSLAMSDGTGGIFFTRPIALVLIVLTALCLLIPLYRLVAGRKARSAGIAPQAGPAQRHDSAVELVLPVMLLAAAIGFLAWSYGYSPRARAFPVLVGWGLVGLSALDLFFRLRSRPGTRPAPVPSVPRAAEPRREIAAIAWVAGFVLAVFAFGFLPVLPVYMLLFMCLHGRQSLWRSVAISAGLSLLLYLGFEGLLQLEIYRGIFFESL